MCQVQFQNHKTTGTPNYISRIFSVNSLSIIGAQSLTPPGPRRWELVSDWLKFTPAWVGTLHRSNFCISIMDPLLCGVDLNQRAGDKRQDPTCLFLKQRLLLFKVTEHCTLYIRSSKYGRKLTKYIEIIYLKWLFPPFYVLIRANLQFCGTTIYKILELHNHLFISKLWTTPNFFAINAKNILFLIQCIVIMATFGWYFNYYWIITRIESWTYYTKYY